MIPQLNIQPGFLEGWIRHRRNHPVQHEMHQNMVWLCIDLSKLEETFEKLPSWNLESSGLHSFYRSDYIGNPAEHPKSSIERRCREEGIQEAIGKVFLICHSKALGLSKIPVSFYLIYNKADTLIAILADFTTHKLKERFDYFLKVTDPSSLEFQGPKRFHMSEYMGMDTQYHWKFLIGKRHFFANVKVYQAVKESEIDNKGLFFQSNPNAVRTKLILDITFTSRLREFNRSNAMSLGRRYLFQSLKMNWLFLWHKFIMRLKQVQKPGHPSENGKQNPLDLPQPRQKRKKKKR